MDNMPDFLGALERGAKMIFNYIYSAAVIEMILFGWSRWWTTSGPSRLGRLGLQLPIHGYMCSLRDRQVLEGVC